MNPNTSSTKTTDYSQNAGYRAQYHSTAANPRTYVIYNAAEYGFQPENSTRWLLVAEPRGHIYAMLPTLKLAKLMLNALKATDELLDRIAREERAI